jgi:hypothetical protein
MRNEAKRDPFSMCFAREKNVFMLLFASDQRKLIERILNYFHFVSLPKVVVSLLFRFVCASFHFVWLQMRKQAKKHFFRIEAKKFRFRFAIFRFVAKMMAVFRFSFASFHFEAKMMAVFRVRFTSFRFEAKMMAGFRFRYASFHFEAKMTAVFRFSLASFHYDAKMMAAFCFRFASFHFEAK